MEKIRIGNDIAIKWAIYAADMLAEVQPETPTPYDLTGRDLSLYVEMGAIRTRIRDFEVNGNEVRFTFFGMYQTTEGVYRLTLVENEGMRGMHTVDYEDAFRLDLPEDVEPLGACECQEEDLMKVFEQDGFELVDSSDLMGGQSEDNVEIVYLSLKSTMLLSGAIDIVDSLDSTRTDAALSANQGRELNERIESTQKEVSTLNADATVPGSVDYKIAKVQMGGFDPSGLVSKEELIEDEDIASAALAELSSRIDLQVASLKRTTSQNLISQVEKLRSSLNDIIIEDEDVVSAALAEQNQRIDSKTDRLERVKATRDELAVQVDSIFSTILENEDIISAALAEINGRIVHMEEVLRTIKSNAL